MNEEIEQIQITLAQAEARVDKAAKWQKLLSDELFIELVTKDYLGDDAVRLTMNVKPKSEDNEIVTNMLMAKSIFSRFVAEVLDQGQQAVVAIEENTQLMNEIDSEA